MKKIYFVDLAKTPWSWGRMYDILSEGRKIESRRQLEKLPIAIRSKRKVEELETKQAHARERPHRRAGGLSKWTRFEARKTKKKKKRLDSKDVD